jgi:hypothetical protein
MKYVRVFFASDSTSVSIVTHLVQTTGVRENKEFQFINSLSTPIVA